MPIPNIPLQELGGTVTAGLKKRRDVLQSRGQQIGRALAPVGKGLLQPRREQQLTRQAAGTQLTPSQLRPQTPPPPKLGERAAGAIGEARERLQPPKVQEQLPSG